jgi:hypothetical protein
MTPPLYSTVEIIEDVEILEKIEIVETLGASDKTISGASK